LRRGPTILTKISSATVGIYCTTSLPLSRAMEDSSIVQVQQLQILYRRRRPHHNLQRMVGTLWNV